MTEHKSVKSVPASARVTLSLQDNEAHSSLAQMISCCHAGPACANDDDIHIICRISQLNVAATSQRQGEKRGDCAHHAANTTQPDLKRVACHPSDWPSSSHLLVWQRKLLAESGSTTAEAK